jgi:membrane fusion protein (multidrug efflux system)
VDSASAVLARAQANQQQADAQLRRSQPLREANAISEQEFVAARTGLALAEADVGVARAALKTAQLSLGHATVVAPISGRIGRALVSEGALVSQAEATQLALIQQTDPVYVNVTQAVADVARLRGLTGDGAAAPVRIVLDDGSELPQAGRLLFADLNVDPSSAQVLLRTEVANPQGRLLPGMYVRARLVQGRIDNAVLLPQQAVTRSATADTVVVVNAQGQAQPRTVQVHSASAGQWVITSGLQVGDQVVVEGFQKMRPGAPVKPVPWTRPVAAAGAAGASAPAAALAASAASR